MAKKKEDNSHSIISPSQAERFFNCPGSVKAQAEIKMELPVSQYAMEGRAIHELAEMCLKTNTHPKKYRGKAIRLKEGKTKVSFTVNDDFIYTVDVYLKAIDKLLEQHNVDRSAIRVEGLVELPEIDENARGTADCYFLAEDTLHVIDLKAGRGIVVSPEENKQCLYYALRPYLDGKMFIRKIVLHIIQPRAKEGDYVKHWETTPERMEKFIIELKEAIAKTKEDKPEFKAGKWCQFCKASGKCLTVQNSLVAQAKEVLPDIKPLFPDIKKLTPEVIGNALEKMYLLKAYMQGLENYAFSLAMQGKEIPNFTLTKSRKHRTWADEESVISAFYNTYGEDIFNKKLRTPAQLEKIIGKEELKDYIVQPEGDLKLVLRKECKDEIKLTVEEAFKNVKFD